MACPANTRVMGLTFDDQSGALSLRPKEGAVSAAECQCEIGFYVAENGLCEECPEGAECLGGTIQPLAIKGFGKMSFGAAHFLKCQNYDICSKNEPGCDCI
eukprot:376959-Prymnesium_polylepis.1